MESCKEHPFVDLQGNNHSVLIYTAVLELAHFKLCLSPEFPLMTANSLKWLILCFIICLIMNQQVFVCVHIGEKGKKILKSLKFCWTKSLKVVFQKITFFKIKSKLSHSTRKVLFPVSYGQCKFQALNKKASLSQWATRVFVPGTVHGDHQLHTILPREEGRGKEQVLPLLVPTLSWTQR